MLSPFSQTIEISFELPPGEPQQVDVWFIPQSRQPIDLLGQLGKMAIAPSLIEVFRNPISTEDLFACIEKLCRVRAEWKRRSKRDNQKINPQDQPQLWLIVPTASEKTLDGCNAIAKRTGPKASIAWVTRSASASSSSTNSPLRLKHSFFDSSVTARFSARR